jgi:hypothetical protein
MAAAIYSTTSQEGIDINSVFLLDVKSAPEYPAPPFLAGELAWGTDGSEWVYCTASVTIGFGNVVIIAGTPGSWSVAPITNTLVRAGFGQLLGVVGGSNGSMFVPAPSGTQTGSYFWVQRAGNAPLVLVGLSVAANATLHSSTTTGGLGATGGAGTSGIVAGIVFSQSAFTAGSRFNAILNYPLAGALD